MPHGVCFYDDKYGFWTGTIVEWAGEPTIKECVKQAMEIADGDIQSLQNGMVLPVNYVVDKGSEQKTVEYGKKVMDQMAGQKGLPEHRTFKEFMNAKQSMKVRMETDSGSKVVSSRSQCKNDLERSVYDEVTSFLKPITIGNITGYPLR
jgi:hypothetical protein